MPYVEYDEVEAICADCGRMFRSEDALVAHREESHSGREDSAPLTSPSESPTCATCHRVFDSTGSLHAHTIRAHPSN